METMNDPYAVLGVSRDASDEEIKKAYRALARKYHPDNYANTNLADVAEEKMKEINEAYDAVQKMRASASSSYSSDFSSYDSTGAGYAGADFYTIRRMMNDGQFSDAEIRLDAMPQNQRGAEWSFLKGCILMQRGYYFDAQKYLETACYLDPSNEEYANARRQMNGAGSAFRAPYNTTNVTSGCSGCDLCSSLLCADCLCECCGGDLIRCC